MLDSGLIVPGAAPGTETPRSDSESFTLLFLDQNRLIAKTEAGEELVATLSDTLGRCFAAHQLEGEVVALCEGGIQRVGEDGSNEVVLYIDESVFRGEVISSHRGAQLLYTIYLNDLQAPASLSTEIGIYDIENGSARSLLSFRAVKRVLGATAGGDELYVLHVGQDPSFGSVSIINMDDGNVVRELPVEGYNYIALSPDSRYIVTVGWDSRTLNLYDVTVDPVVRQEIAGPRLDSTLRGLFWSPQSDEVYFATYDRSDDPIQDFGPSGGLWKLSLATLTVSRVLDAEIGDIVVMSSDGRWLLTRPDPTSNELMLIDLSDLTIHTVTLPIESVIVGWR